MTDDSFAQGLVGVTLDGRYRLDAVLGEGGMGSVFRATHLAMDRKVAVKLLKPHLTSDEGALQRFAREARATFKVDSPHAVKILDFGVTPHQDYYMVLEYLDGRTVHREIEIDGPFAPARVAHIARQALHALGAAHARGMIHRDVKPDNLLLMRVGNDADYTKILDFGVAKLMQGTSDRSQLALTAAGMVFGTPEFMSPEQACGQPLDGRSDLYSLAATMFVMLTGAALFEGKNAIELLTHHARTPPPRLAMARPELAAYPELDELLQRCLAKQREQRPENAAAMAAQIERLEPTLTRAAAVGPAAVGQSPTPRAFHASSYFHVLHDPAPAAAADDLGSAVMPSVSLPRAAKRSRRGWYLWLGGAVIASLLGIVIGLVIRGSASRSTSLSASTQEPAFANAVDTRSSARSSVADPARAGNASANVVGGSQTGGSQTGGSQTGGSQTGGSQTGGSQTGGSQTGGSQTGGSQTGGSQTGGSQTGGSGHSLNASSQNAGSLRNNPTPASHSSPGDHTHSKAPLTTSPASSAPGKLLSSSGPQVAGPRSTAPGGATEPGAPSQGTVDEHLRNAELARRAGNQLKQIVELDLALRAEPGHAHAKYLLGDALIKSGDLERGCAYLRELKRNAQARKRARLAGCPGN